MKTQFEYEDSRPLRRIEKGDVVQIIVINPEVQHKKFLSEKAKLICEIPNGHYKAICVSESPTWQLECKEQPLLSGAYTYWMGNKYHFTGIYADELDSEQWGKYEQTAI